VTPIVWSNNWGHPLARLSFPESEGTTEVTFELTFPKAQKRTY